MTTDIIQIIFHPWGRKITNFTPREDQKLALSIALKKYHKKKKKKNTAKQSDKLVFHSAAKKIIFSSAQLIS